MFLQCSLHAFRDNQYSYRSKLSLKAKLLLYPITNGWMSGNVEEKMQCFPEGSRWLLH